MGHRALRFLFFLIFASCCPFLSGFSGVLAERNVTIDDVDPTIIYSPPRLWTHSPGDSFFLSTYTWAVDPSAIATFNFTGVAIYLLVPWIKVGKGLLITQPINATVSLDFAHPILLNHSPSNAVGSQPIIWYATGLENRPHTLQISPGGATPSAMIDGLMYTVGDGPALTTPVSPPAPSPPSKRKRSIAVLLGPIFGTLGLLIILFFAWYFWRKRHRHVNESWTDGDGASGGDPATRSMAGTDKGGGFSKVLGAPGIARKGTKHDSGHDGQASRTTQPGFGPLMQHTPEGNKVIPRYGVVDASPPPLSLTSRTPTHGPQFPQTPASGYAYPDEDGYSHANHPQPYPHRPLPTPPILRSNTLAPNRRESSNTLSTTRETSTPQMPGNSRAGKGLSPPILPESGFGAEPQ